MQNFSACDGHKKTSQGEVEMLLTRRVAGLAMTSFAISPEP
jgi:hypothetical protein